MEFTLYLIYYVSFAILSFASLEIPSLRTSESDLFTTYIEEVKGQYKYYHYCVYKHGSSGVVWVWLACNHTQLFKKGNIKI